MKKEKRVDKIFKRLREEYPEPNGTEINYENPVQLLVATILSAQSTDETTNEITSKLFREYKTVEDFANAEREELEELIYSSGFYRNKAKWIQESCQKLVEDFGGEVPRDIDELIELKGVGRKTANIVLSDAFGINQGIAVDTHVMRLSKRLSLSEEDYREKIESDLMDLIPQEDWYNFSTLLIKHGRRICESRNPDCEGCIISDLCPSAFSFD